MNKLSIAVVALALAVAAGCHHPQVVQGTVLSLSEDETTLTLQDELAPNEPFEVSIKNAEVGAPPAPGDVVRIAFYVRDEGRVATRVMNLTRQAELTKKR